MVISDAVNGAPRSLSVGMDISSPLTNELCTAACFQNGYGLAGTEFAGWVA